MCAAKTFLEIIHVFQNYLNKSKIHPGKGFKVKQTDT